MAQDHLLGLCNIRLSHRQPAKLSKQRRHPVYIPYQTCNDNKIWNISALYAMMSKKMFPYKQHCPIKYSLHFCCGTLINLSIGQPIEVFCTENKVYSVKDPRCKSPKQSITNSRKNPNAKLSHLQIQMEF